MKKIRELLMLIFCRLKNLEDCCAASNCSLSVSINPTGMNPPFDTDEYKVFNQPTVVISGGTAPFTYLWSLQQTGGSQYYIDDPTTPTMPKVFSGQQSPPSSNLIQSPLDAMGSNSGTCPAYSGNIESERPISALHYKLVVTDANGCSSADYWTQYFSPFVFN